MKQLDDIMSVFEYQLDNKVSMAYWSLFYNEIECAHTWSDLKYCLRDEITNESI